MAIPRPSRPEYSTTIPSNGKKIRYQPFTIREEKALILAAEGEDADEIANAVVNCIKNCVTSPTDFDVESLAIFDIEYIFLKCRAKSVGEKIDFILRDPSDETFSIEQSVNIDKITVTKDKNHTDLIDIEGMKIKMKYPDISFFTEGVNISNITTSTTALTRCISQIIVDEEVFNRVDMTDEELTEWIEGLSQKQYNALLEFFVTMPRLSHKLTARNTNTGKDFSVTLEGLSDFF